MIHTLSASTSRTDLKNDASPVVISVIDSHEEGTDPVVFLLPIIRLLNEVRQWDGMHQN